jgi:hypothetical protein
LSFITHGGVRWWKIQNFLLFSHWKRTRCFGFPSIFFVKHFGIIPPRHGSRREEIATEMQGERRRRRRRRKPDRWRRRGWRRPSN